jgi:phytoene dehydrogenase-like protein
LPKYDLTVAGAGLGGLTVAALMSSIGKKVVVVESGVSMDAALGVREFDGFHFYQGPAISYGFEQGGIFNEIFAKLGNTPEVLKPMHRFQVALPDRRITVSSNQEETHDELKREFPREILSIEKLYHDIKNESAHIMKSRIATYFAKRKSATSFISKYHFSREFTIYLEMQSRFFFQKTLSQISLTQLITLCGTMPTRFHGGTKALADQLLRELRKSGGDIAFGEGIVEIAFNNGRPIGLKTDQHMIEANSILLNAPHQQPPTYFLGILDDVVPVAMEQDVLYLPDYDKSDEFLFISVSADNDISSAPMMARALTVSLQSSNSRQRDQDEIIGPLSKIIPYLNENVFFIEPSPIIQPSFKLSKEVTFRPIRSSNVLPPILFKTSKRHLYMLQDTQYMPLDLMTAAHKFVATIL